MSLRDELRISIVWLSRCGGSVKMLPLRGRPHKLNIISDYEQCSGGGAVLGHERLEKNCAIRRKGVYTSYRMSTGMSKKIGVIACGVALGLVVLSSPARSGSFNSDRTTLSDSDASYLSDLVDLLGQAPERQKELQAFLQMHSYLTDAPPSSYTEWHDALDQLSPTSSLRDTQHLLMKAIDQQRQGLELATDKSTPNAPGLSESLMNSSRENLHHVYDQIHAAFINELPENLKAVHDALYNASMPVTSTAVATW
jgi:hypothetical protein